MVGCATRLQASSRVCVSVRGACVCFADTSVLLSLSTRMVSSNDVGVIDDAMEMVRSVVLRHKAGGGAAVAETLPIIAGVLDSSSAGDFAFSSCFEVLSLLARDGANDAAMKSFGMARSVLQWAEDNVYQSAPEVCERRTRRTRAV